MAWSLVPAILESGHEITGIYGRNTLTLNPLVDKLEAKNMKRSTATALILGGFVFLLIVCIVPVYLNLSIEALQSSKWLPASFLSRASNARSSFISSGVAVFS